MASEKRRNLSVVVSRVVGRGARGWGRSDLEAGTLVTPLEAHSPSDLELMHAVYVGGGTIPHRVRAFIDHLVKTLYHLAIAAVAP